MKFVAYDPKKHGPGSKYDTGECLLCNKARRSGVVVLANDIALFYCETCVRRLHMKLPKAP